MKKIIFRADADSEIGYGHFIRSLALADMLKYNFDCYFATIHPTAYQLNEIAETCEYLSLPAGHDHFECFLSLLHGDEIVVLDNYFYNTDYQRKIRAKGCRLVCIDDMHDKHYVADVVINHTPGLFASMFSIEPYTRLYLGADYLLMRKPFREVCEKAVKKSCNDAKAVFVCFGGADEFKLTLQVAEILLEHTNFRVNAVVGNSFSVSDDLLSDDRIVLYKNLSSTEMVDLIEKCCFAVVSASSVFFEVCCVRKPIISGYYVDNQIEVASFIEQEGLGMNCGNFLDNLHKKIVQKIQLLDSTVSEKMITSQQRIIKDSAGKLISIFLNL